ncbi:MAG: hypothetical protein JXB07_20895 [Anaerolineae bacterium]|nr:hypothetical protein [Anaerolineae bacterium]
MQQNTSLKSIKSILPILLGGGIILLGCLFIGGTLIFVLASSQGDSTEATPAVISEFERTLSFPTATVLPSSTPTPTDTATPAPTDTPTATNTSIPPTYPPATKIPPTAVPTNTDAPPPTVTPGSRYGVKLLFFNTDAPTYARTQPIKYEYTIKNTGGGSADFGFLGANLVDAAGNVMLFKLSWQGRDADHKWPLNPSGELGVKETLGGIADPGTYHIQAVICYSIPKHCNTPGAGEWEILGTATFTIN